MSISEDQLRQVLGQVPYPGFSKDVLSAGIVRELRVTDGTARLDLALDDADPQTARRVEDAIRQALLSVPGIKSIQFKPPAGGPSDSLNVINNPGAGPAKPPKQEPRLLPGVREIVVVASGKGGVGKSTVAVNLAVALARRGGNVGLLDADIHGPSVPLMMGAVGLTPKIDPQNRRPQPLERFGVKFMSVGFFVEPEKAMIWRGPMVAKALVELLTEVDWGNLDVLVIDMPPGTGDVQLSLSQLPGIRLSGAVIVTTPQDVALADAIKGVNMFQTVGVPVMGLVENMSYFECPHCSERTDVFGHGGGKAQAKRLDVPFLGEIPLEPEIRSSSDSGEPVASGAEDRPSTASFLKLADSVNATLKAEVVRR